MGEQKEKTLSSQRIFTGKILTLYHDQVELPNGNTASREVVRHHGAVCIVPLTQDEQVVMEKQYRYPVDQVIWEIPAGKLEPGEKDPLLAAKRELAEETGAIAEEWVDMGLYYPACAYCDEGIRMYMAKGLTFGERHLDQDEFLDVELVPLREMVEAVLAGKIPDLKTQAALLRAWLILHPGELAK